MPYISRDRRDFFAPTHVPSSPGELNYAITALACAYIVAHGKGYATINEVVGAMECAKQEFYARVAGPYEDQKRLENGDVYDAANRS